MNTKSFLSILAVVVLLLAGGLYMRTKSTSVEVVNVSTSVPTDVSPTPSTGGEAQTSTLLYKNGTYTAKGSYRAPSGEEIIDVSVTLSGDVITDSSVVGHATNPASIANQKDFIENYKQYVTGKKIGEVNLTKVSGSSLTSTGWNATIENIKSQAKA